MGMGYITSMGLYSGMRMAFCIPLLDLHFNHLEIKSTPQYIITNMLVKWLFLNEFSKLKFLQNPEAQIYVSTELLETMYLKELLISVLYCEDLSRSIQTYLSEKENNLDSYASNSSSVLQKGQLKWNRQFPLIIYINDLNH